MIQYGHKIVLYLTIVSLVVVIFLQRNCSPQIKQYNDTQKVVIKEKVGSIDKPITIIEIRKQRDTIKFNNQDIITESHVDKTMVKDYLLAQKENDSLKALNLYLRAIGEKSEIRTFDNRDLNLKVTTKTRGEILDMKIDYERKEFTEDVIVKQKETRFAVYTGAALGYTSDMNKIIPKVLIGVQNRKGDIISFEAGTDKSIQIGYSLRIINIKK